jgi:hypothetical protein
MVNLVSIISMSVAETRMDRRTDSNRQFILFGTTNQTSKHFTKKKARNIAFTLQQPAQFHKLFISTVCPSMDYTTCLREQPVL